MSKLKKHLGLNTSFYTVPTERCMLEGSVYVRPPRNVRLSSSNKGLYVEASFFQNYAYWYDMSDCQLSSKSSTFLTFILKVKDCNRVHWEVRIWLSRKRQQIGQTLLLPIHKKPHVTFRLAYLHLTLAHSKDQGHGHTHFDCEYLTNDDR